MSAEARELNQHIDWLKDQLDWLGHIEDKLDEIKGDVGSTHNRLDDIESAVDGHTNKLNELVQAVNSNTNKLNEVVVAVNSHADALRKLADALRPAAPSPPPSDFAATFNETTAAFMRPLRPKRQKFKPKVVKNNEPDKPGAA